MKKNPAGWFLHGGLILCLGFLGGACGGDGGGGTEPGEGSTPPSAQSLIGVWFASGAYGEHTLFLAANGRWVDLFSTLVDVPDFDPYEPDPTIGYGEGFQGGTYRLEGQQILFTYWEDGRTRAEPLATEGLSTPGRDDDLLTIGSRNYLFEAEIAGEIHDPTPLPNVQVRVTRGSEESPFHVFSTAESLIETDPYGAYPVTLVLSSIGGDALEVHIAQASWIRVGEPLAFDGYRSLGVHCVLDDWEGLWEIWAEHPAGRITFTQFEPTPEGDALVSGTISGARLYDALSESGASVVVEASFQGIVIPVGE
jgi:hypothetical protein